MATKSSGVVVVGSANQDLISYTPILPTIGETVMGEAFETSCGGKGANQAVAAASLGIVPITMVCRVGQDSFGANLLANFRKVGVQFEEETTMAHESHSGVAPIVVDTTTGDNMIIVIPGANYVLTPEDAKSAILAAKPAVVVSQLEIRPETALAAMKAGKQVGAITILNPAPAPEGWTLDEFYPFVDILIPNETELLSLCKGGSEQDMARSLLKKGVGKAVVVTLGARGAMLVTKIDNDDEGEVTLVKAPEELPCRDEPVLDTIGAGDAFCGALSTYLSAGLELTDAATKACGVASMSVRKKGAQTSYPTASELPDCLKIASSTTVSATKPTITFVTGNRWKVDEIKRFLLDGDTELPFEITNRKIDLPELQGDPLEIAQEKCRFAAKEVNGPVLTDDTSLCFNSLKGMPGPYIKWFLQCGHDGLNKMLAGFDDKSAYAQTVMAFTTGPGQEIELFDGRTDGTIVPPRGSLNFGWDPVFEPKEGKGKTYAEMTKEEKNAISHRSGSMAKLKSYLHENADDIIAKK
jgi:ribokinase/non-canonical purine NTP pyrophosphatase (RdgB/HAM1 family)